MEENNVAIRINKYLADQNICSRREADQLVAKGKVRINGRVAVLGDRVLPTDNVQIFEKEEKKKQLVYLAFNKPKGVITHSPQRGERSIEQVLKFPQKVFPIGRLDKDSCGLIILTNDGRITGRILEPKNFHDKEYVVTVDRRITPIFVRQMESGVKLEDGYFTRKCQVRKIDKLTFSIILTEGKKRQIRRMCERLGYQVTELKRIRIMNILLDNLKSGQHRKIEGEELETFFGLLGFQANSK
jgi:23S rRNA pseudouridine2604 synthase